MNKLDELNVNVVDAIRRVEEAVVELVNAELIMAKATSPNSTEGRIARCGVIRTARATKSNGWVNKLLESFLAEDGISEMLSIELKALAFPEHCGRWYLLYSFPFPNDKVCMELSLKATTEVEAIAEGSVKWAEESAKVSATHPRIIYRVLL